MLLNQHLVCVNDRVNLMKLFWCSAKIDVIHGKM